MLLRLLLLIAPLAPVLTARYCNSEPTSEERVLIQHVQDLKTFSTASSNKTLIEVPLYFHVVSNGTLPEDGNIPEPLLQDQFRVLNAAFSPHNILFDLQEITRTINPVWATEGESIEMNRALRRGNYTTLNIYFMTKIPDLLGACSYPRIIDEDETFEDDGCIVHADSVPGGSYKTFNLGMTAVHEAGHWFGLHHLFGEDCETDNDFVSDTPMQAVYFAHDCRPIDSCPDMPGIDAVHNYMAYAPDACLEEFSVGQGTRMRAVFTLIREGRLK